MGILVVLLSIFDFLLYLCKRMKLDPKYKVREMAGEHIIVMPGNYGVDMTRVVALNPTSLYLWNVLVGKEFETADVADLIVKEYEIDRETAVRDAEKWVAQLRDCGIL